MNIATYTFLKPPLVCKDLFAVGSFPSPCHGHSSWRRMWRASSSPKRQHVRPQGRGEHSRSTARCEPWRELKTSHKNRGQKRIVKTFDQWYQCCHIHPFFHMLIGDRKEHQPYIIMFYFCKLPFKRLLVWNTWPLSWDLAPMGTWASVAEGTTTAPEWLMPGNSTQWQAYLVYSPILASPILEASSYFPSTGFESPGKLPTVGPTKVASLVQPPLAPARQEPTQLKRAGQVCCGRAWQNL